MGRASRALPMPVGTRSVHPSLPRRPTAAQAASAIGRRTQSVHTSSTVHLSDSPVSAPLSKQHADAASEVCEQHMSERGQSDAPLRGALTPSRIDTPRVFVPRATGRAGARVWLLATVLGVLALACSPAAASAAAPEPPGTEPATAVTATTATLNGTLNPNASAAAGYLFTFNTNGTCTEGPATQQEPEVTGEAVHVETALTGLEPSREYTVCLLATHLEGETTETASGEPVTFKTLASPPAVDAQSVSALTAFSATLEAQVNANNQETSVSFQYSTQATGETLEGEVTTVPANGLGAEFGDRTATGETGHALSPGTTYFYRAIAENTAAERTEGPVQQFTTPGAPTIALGEAHSVTRTTALIDAEIDAHGAATEYFLEYGQAEPYGAPGSPTALAKLGAEPAGPQAIPPIALEELRPATVYRYRVVAINEAGTTDGPEGTFTTAAAQPPAATTGEALEVTLTTATITGTVNPNGLPTSYVFEIGTDTNYGTSIFGEAGVETADEPEQLALTGLLPGTTYHYRLLATNPDGTAPGPDRTFTTPGLPTLLIQPATPALLPFTAPSETPGAGNTPPPKSPTRAQKLAKALKTCARQPRRKRNACIKHARKRYGPAKKTRK